MKYAWRQFRCYMTELSFHWMLAWAPSGSREEIAVIRAFETYQSEIGPG